MPGIIQVGRRDLWLAYLLIHLFQGPAMNKTPRIQRWTSLGSIMFLLSIWLLKYPCKVGRGRRLHASVQSVQVSLSAESRWPYSYLGTISVLSCRCHFSCWDTVGSRLHKKTCTCTESAGWPRVWYWGLRSTNNMNLSRPCCARC